MKGPVLKPIRRRPSSSWDAQRRSDVEKVNEILAGISEEERVSLMDQAVLDQPADASGETADQGLIADFKIIDDYGMLFCEVLA